MLCVASVYKLMNAFFASDYERYDFPTINGHGPRTLDSGVRKK